VRVVERRDDVADVAVEISRQFGELGRRQESRNDHEAVAVERRLVLGKRHRGFLLSPRVE
jgi:hypothetical protein